MTIAQEEIFGPVVSFITYDDVDDAIAKANNTIYGLHGAVYTQDPERGYEVARRVRSGSVTVNGMIVDPKMPFGGFKQSGIGPRGRHRGARSVLRAEDRLLRLVSRGSCGARLRSVRRSPAFGLVEHRQEQERRIAVSQPAHWALVRQRRIFAPAARHPPLRAHGRASRPRS